MKMAQDLKKKFQDQWSNECQQINGGLKGSYSLNRSKLISRDRSGIAFKGIGRFESRNNQIQYQQVIIKQCYSSKNEKIQIPNQEALFSKVNHKNEFKLKTIDFFPGQKPNSLYLVSQSYQYSLQEISKQNYNQFRGQEMLLQQLCSNIMEVLAFLHFEMGNQAVVHRNINPTCIVKRKGNGKGKFCLRDYSYATFSRNLPLKDDLNQLNYRYQVPQIQKKASGEIDVWSFGCIIYEVLSGTERLIENEQYYKYLANENQKKEYIDQRMFRLKWKLEEFKEMIQINFWLELVYICLRSDVKKKNSKDIRQMIAQHSKGNHTSPYQSLNNKRYNQKQVQSKILQEIVFESIRLSIISDRIMTMFDQMYHPVANLNRFQFYVILKFASHYFSNKYSKIKETIRLYFNNRYNRFKSIQGNQDKNIIIIRQKSIAKIKKQIKQANIQQKLYYESVINKYPQILAQSLNQSNSRKMLCEFCFDIRNKLNQPIFQTIGQMIFYSRYIEDYPSLLLKGNQINSRQASMTINFMKLNRQLKTCININWVNWILENARNRLDLIVKFNELIKKQKTKA